MNEDQKKKSSKLFNRMKQSAADTVVDAELLSAQANAGQAYATSLSSSTLTHNFAANLPMLFAAFRMLRAFANRSYREVPYATIIMLSAAIAYLVMPLDAIPDFIPVVGLADDASVFGMALGFVASDLNAFIEWEKTQQRKA